MARSGTNAVDRGAHVWVWLTRSQWHAGVVVAEPFVLNDCLSISVQLDHGVTATLGVEYVLPRHPALDGADKPVEAAP